MTAPTAAATSTARCPPPSSTTPPTSRSRRSPGRWATPPTRPRSPTGRRTGATCSTRTAGSSSPATPTAPGPPVSIPTSGTDFVEGDSFIYTGMVPFNLAGLAAAKGGDTAMNDYLTPCCAASPAPTATPGSATSPASSCPGSTTTPASPTRPRSTVRDIQDQIWTDTPAGLADGNDDLGEMSSWYVWSALGMYPETPGTADLALGSPMFTQAVITLPIGNTLTINGNGAADDAPYVQSATWNGAAWNNAYAPTAAITSGGTLSYTLGTTANTSWAPARPRPRRPTAATPSRRPSPQVGPIASGVAPACASTTPAPRTPTATRSRSGAATAPPPSPGPSPPTAPPYPRQVPGRRRRRTTAGTLVDLYNCNGDRRPAVDPRGQRLAGQPRSPAYASTTPTSAPPRAPSSRSTPATAPPAQNWTLPAAPPVEPAPSPRASAGLCVDDSAASTANGTPIQI